MFNDNDRLQQLEDNWNGQDPEYLQERADEFRKDDSLPEPDFLEGVQVCKIDNFDCEACQ